MEITGGQCLVAWDILCRPLNQGGLGIKDLKLQGLALRVRWEWLKRMDPERPWQGLPMLKDERARAVFNTLTVISVGDGKQVLFWTDRWTNRLTASEIAPLVADSVAKRTKNGRRVAEALLQNAWIRDVGGGISLEGWYNV
jgi:hypothetical protein